MTSQEQTVSAVHPGDVVLFASSYCMGGIEHHITDLARGLIRRGWNVALICSTMPHIGPLRHEMRHMGVTVHAVPEAGNPFGLIPRAWRLISILRTHPGCLVHLHLQGESGGMLVLLAARLARVRGVLRTLHNPPVPPIGRVNRLLVRTSERWLDRVISVSRDTRDAQKREFNRDSRKSVVIPNGVDLKRFSLRIRRDEVRIELGIGPDEPVIGTVARLEEERKGIGDFVEMAADLRHRWPQARFMIVGDGPLRRKLEAQVARHGLADQVLFTGYRADVPRLIAAMDVSVFPSSYEAAPYVMLEAMAMARPVVITPTGLAVDLINQGVTGMLVPFHDPAAMSRAVDQLLSDPAKATRIGYAGHDLVVKAYSTDVMVDLIERLYEELISPMDATPAQRQDQASTA